MHIGRYLRKKRKEKGLSILDLAFEVGVDEKTIRRIEKEEKPSKTKSLKKVYVALGISPMDRQIFNDLLKYDNEMNHLNPLGLYNDLGDNGPQEILSTLNENLLKGYELAKQGMFQEALQIYLALSKLYPKKFAYIACATLYQMLDEHEKAIEFTDKVLSLEKDQFEALFIKGTSLGELKHYDSAMGIFEKALELKKSYPLHYNLGYINWLKKDYVSAIKHYNKCLEINPDYASAHLNAGVCYFDMMRLEESLFHIDEAIRLEPNMYQAYGRKGEYYRFIDQHDEAIKYFVKCLKLNPKNYQALLGISISFAILGDISQSSIYFKRFFEYYLNNLIDNNGVPGRNVQIVDIGYKKTRFIEVKYENQNHITVFINGLSIPLNMNKGKGLIFIGSSELKDSTGSILYPVVGKLYRDEVEFAEVKTKVQDSVELFRYFDEPRYIDFKKDIKVNIDERENNVLIKITFGEKYVIAGITDSKTGGLESFIEHYKKHGQFRVHFECATEMFVIDGLKNVSINLLNSNSK
ncbi:tetratricopeptide repeat protein [Bacillus sp. T3]|uniref:tetratricopeptide repeat protein n=1 Tax=Bacillus sp. T3 TaxID=467262 RepID=UPI0029810E8C|nr:tetratricopeptide repeat protein [Bacillus sp. T3]